MSEQGNDTTATGQDGIGVAGRGDVVTLSNAWQTGNLMYRKNYIDLETAYPMLLNYEEQWWKYASDHWECRDNEWFNREAYIWLSNCQNINGGRIDPAPRHVKDVSHVIRSICYHDDNGGIPSWVRVPGDEKPMCAAKDAIAFKNGILDVNAMDVDPVMGEIKAELQPHSPRWFSANVLPYSFKPEAECPTWLDFLDETFRGDAEQISCLHEWIGYCLTHDTSQQKCALFVGPKRTGKSTICNMMSAIVGESNVATPKLSSLAMQFGLHALLNKTVAIIGDAHLDKGSSLHVLETIKAITGEDKIDVPRKHLPDLVNQRIGVRFTISCNEIPDLPDVGSTLGPRVLGFSFTNSVVGREDRSLTKKLLIEIPGIVNEAIRGLDRLRKRGELLQPDSGANIVHLISDDADGLSSFLDEWCLIRDDLKDPAYHTLVDDLHKAYVEFRKDAGGLGIRKEKFLKRLHAIRPALIEVMRSKKLDGVKRRIIPGIRIKPEFLKEFGHCRMTYIPGALSQYLNPLRSSNGAPTAGFSTYSQQEPPEPDPPQETQGHLDDIPI